MNAWVIKAWDLLCSWNCSLLKNLTMGLTRPVYRSRVITIPSENECNEADLLWDRMDPAPFPHSRLLFGAELRNRGVLCSFSTGDEILLQFQLAIVSMISFVLILPLGRCNGEPDLGSKALDDVLYRAQLELYPEVLLVSSLCVFCNVNVPRNCNKKIK